MFKRNGYILFSLGLFIVIFGFVCRYNNKRYLPNETNVTFAFYLEDLSSSVMPKKEDNYTLDVEKTNCTEGASIKWDYDGWSPIVMNLTSSRTKCSLYFREKVQSYVAAEYDYSGNVETFTALHTGIYKLEAWGAQGGSVAGVDNAGVSHSYPGGYGAYSTATVVLSQNDKLFVVVGGQGESGYPTENRNGGYNGGGTVYKGSDTSKNRYVAGGGGATHIADENYGVLTNYESYISNLVIVAGGGGGSYLHVQVGYYGIGGHGGGASGTDGTVTEKGNYYGTGATQLGPGYAYGANTIGLGAFGLGGSIPSLSHGSAGGGGYYGGGASYGGVNENGNSAGGGGSGYIGYPDLIDKYMVCYNCTAYEEEAYKTISVSSYSEQATADTAKSGDGYVRITFLEEY